MAKIEKLCCICGKPFDDELNMGNNALPYREGRCCSKCNRKYVIPSRGFSSALKGRMTTLFNDAVNEIESGEFELSYNRMYDFGFKLKDKYAPKEFKEWKRNYYVDYCRNSNDLKDIETKLISAAESKLKAANNVWVEYIAEKSDYYVRLINVSLKHPRE